MTDDNQSNSQTHIYANVSSGEVTVRDDGGSLEEIEEITERMLDQILEERKDLIQDPPNGGVH